MWLHSCLHTPEPKNVRLEILNDFLHKQWWARYQLQCFLLLHFSSMRRMPAWFRTCGWLQTPSLWYTALLKCFKYCRLCFSVLFITRLTRMLQRLKTIFLKKCFLVHMLKSEKKKKEWQMEVRMSEYTKYRVGPWKSWNMNFKVNCANTPPQLPHLLFKACHL